MRLVDADALVKELSGKYIIVPADEAARGVADFMGIQIRQAINNAPTVDAVPLEDYRSMEQTVHKLAQALAEAEPVKHGRWINERVHNLHNGEQRNARECSECGAIYFIYDMANAIDEVPRYCPNCGARMDEVEE